MDAEPQARLLEHADVKGLTLEDWRGRLMESVHHPIQNGVVYPGFPDEETQKTFVGSAFEDALGEAYNFYSHIHKHLPQKAPPASRYLDFGCGWGRIGRFFLRDFERGDMVGVDVDPGMISFCSSSTPGSYFTINNDAPLPFADASFRLVTAYSVFTHLPERLFRLWLSDLLRITAPGGLIAFTVEPERFLDFAAGIEASGSSSPWHRAIHAALGDLETRRRELHASGMTYLPTGGGPYRPPEVYGEMVVKPQYIEKCVSGLGEVVDFVDSPADFWQAVVVVRRKSFLPRRINRAIFGR